MEDITTPDNKAKNYVYYEARTLHDSSLSKAIHSITACDLGMEKEAYEMFMSAAPVSYTHLMELKRRYPGIDAFFCASDGIAIGAIDGMMQLGMQRCV